MSHYAVAVFSNKDGGFEELLERYNERDEKYYVFIPVTYDSILERFKKFKKHNTKWTLEMFIEEFRYIQQDGRWGYRTNPNGYWDWYSLDGREYMYDLKEGAVLQDGAWNYRKNDYDWYPDNSLDAKEAAEFWDDFIGDTALAEPPGIWSKDYFLQRYKTREQYIKEASRTVPYAFITPDGKWHSPGVVRYFAASDDTAESWDTYVKEWDKFIARPENPYVNLVDCHT